MSNVYMTPFGIRDAIMASFPQAEVHGEVNQGAFVLKCTPIPGSEPILINRAVDALQFGPALNELLENLRYRKAFGQPVEDINFDPSRFSMASPLLDWQKFQRATLKENDGDYKATLSQYLRGIDTTRHLQALEQLGLAPDQLRECHTPDDLDVFRQTVQYLESLDQGSLSTSFVRLKQEYPAIYGAIVEERLQKSFVPPTTDTHRETLEILSARVVGHHRTVELLASTLNAQVNQSENAKFLFVGPTGVGKTELAKAVGSIKQDRFVSLPMNRYNTEYSSSDLFGASTSLVGCQDRPHFIKLLDKFHPVEREPEGATKVYTVENVVVLFDEIEKAHTDVKNTLLDLLDEGYCTIKYVSPGENFAPGVNVNEKYIFRNSIFIGTSNLYQEAIVNSFIEGKELEAISEEFELHNRTPLNPNNFSPEFLGRFNKIVPFGPIDKGEDYQRLLEMKMRTRFRKLKLELKCEDVCVDEGKKPEILQILEEIFYGNGTNIRKIEHFFGTDIKNFITSKIATKFTLADKRLVLTPIRDGSLGIRVDVSLMSGMEIREIATFPLPIHRPSLINANSA